MAGRQTRGRQRIPIRRIESQDDLYATFSKRRLGLYKKASELCTLCGADIGIIIFSPTNNPFSFFHPSMESVIDQYRNPELQLSDQSRVVEAHARARIQQLNTRLDEVLDQKDRIKEREKELGKIEKTRPKGWWEEPIENLNREQVKEWMAFFQNFSNRIKNRIEELKNGGSSSAPAFLPQNPPNFPYDAPALGPNYQAQQFPGHEYYVNAPLTQYPSGANKAGPSHYYLPPPPPPDSFAASRSSDYFLGQYVYSQNPSTDGDEAGPSHQRVVTDPPLTQYQSSAGGAGPSYYYISPQPGDPFGGGGGADADAGPSHYYLPPVPPRGGGGSSGYLPGQYGYGVPQSQNTYTRGGTDQAGPSHQGI